MEYIQRDETRYSNNEYPNMPSIDYSSSTLECITSKNKGSLELESIKSVCDKFGFKYTFINSTFGTDRCSFVAYLKTDIDFSEYERIRKNFFNVSEDERQWYRGLNNRYNEKYKELHDCIHELDEKTSLVFNVGWCGNSGLFGSSDVKRRTYSGANSLSSWTEITNCWGSLITDVNSKFSKGVYIIAQSRYIKPKKECSPLLEECETTLLEEVRNIIGDKYTAMFEDGKRQYEQSPYRALVVRGKETNEYCGMLRFCRDFLGRYVVICAAPLCGETSWVMNWKQPRKDLEKALSFVL